MKTEKIDWKESTCPICGKKFIPAPEHVYRRRVRTSLRYICSYHCTLEYDKNKIDRRHARSSKSLRSVKADEPEGKGTCGAVTKHHFPDEEKEKQGD